MPQRWSSGANEGDPSPTFDYLQNSGFYSYYGAASSRGSTMRRPEVARASSNVQSLGGLQEDESEALNDLPHRRIEAQEEAEANDRVSSLVRGRSQITSSAYSRALRRTASWLAGPSPPPELPPLPPPRITSVSSSLYTDSTASTFTLPPLPTTEPRMPTFSLPTRHLTDADWFQVSIPSAPAPVAPHLRPSPSRQTLVPAVRPTPSVEQFKPLPVDPPAYLPPVRSTSPIRFNFSAFRTRSHSQPQTRSRSQSQPSTIERIKTRPSAEKVRVGSPGELYLDEKKLEEEYATPGGAVRFGGISPSSSSRSLVKDVPVSSPPKGMKKSEKRRMLILCFVAALVGIGLILGVVLGLRSQGTPVESRRIVVFGSSYSDNGHVRNSSYSGSLTSVPYIGGRSTDGPVWVEYLAQLLAAKGESTAEMQNYAYTGATIDNTLTNSDVPSTRDQMSAFLADIASGAVTKLPTNARTLVTIWAGFEQLFSVYNSTLTSFPTLPPVALTIAKAQMTTNARVLISQLSSFKSNANVNTADLLILPLPPAELLPLSAALSAGNSTTLSFIAQMSSTFNSALSAEIASFVNTTTSGSVWTFDTAALFRDIAANVTTSNNATLTDIVNTSSACVSGSKACQAPDSYLWWDSINPTTDVHQYVAEVVAPLVKSAWGP